MRTIPAVFIVLALLAFAIGTIPAANALPLKKCAHVFKNRVGSETLVNRCGQCMTIKVERKRPGNSGAPPTMRDFTVPADATQPLPFKGPGATRIVSEFPCRG